MNYRELPRKKKYKMCADTQNLYTSIWWKLSSQGPFLSLPKELMQSREHSFMKLHAPWNCKTMPFPDWLWSTHGWTNDSIQHLTNCEGFFSSEVQPWVTVMPITYRQSSGDHLWELYKCTSWNAEWFCHTNLEFTFVAMLWSLFLKKKFFFFFLNLLYSIISGNHLIGSNLSLGCWIKDEVFPANAPLQPS